MRRVELRDALDLAGERGVGLPLTSDGDPALAR